MHKQEWRIDCRLRDDGMGHWKAVFFVNACWFFSCSFRTWALAVSAADDKHADLVESGWAPVAADSEAETTGPAPLAGQARILRGPA